MSTENKADELVNELRKAVQDFSFAVNAEEWNTTMRTMAEDIVIIADQVADRQDTIADLRTRVGAMQKAGDAMHKRLGSDIDYLRIDAKAEAMRERDEWISTTTSIPTNHGK